MLQKESNTTRNMGIDLLRIVSMFLVVFLHVLGRGGVLESAPILSVNYEIAWFIEIAAYCAVNCYALISGYVGIRGHYRYSNLVLLWLRVAFYTILITFVFAVGTTGKVGKQEILGAIFPISTEQYWYFTAYAGMFLFIPFVNLFVQRASQSQVRAVIHGCILLFSILPTVFRRDIFVLKDGYSALWMLILYLIGGYIGKYGFWQRKKSSHLAIIYFSCVMLSWLCKFGIEAERMYLHGETRQTQFLVNYTSPTILLAGIVLLLIFSRIKAGGMAGKLIALFAPLSFSVYLIHFHPLVKYYVLQNRFSWITGLNPLMMVGTLILIVVVIFISCSLFDMIREYIFKKIKLKKKLIQLEEKLIGDLWKQNNGTGKRG